MNRRQLLRTAVGAGAAVASLPVLSKLAEANSRTDMGKACMSIPCNGPAYTPPPLDVRTPEQVLEDAEKNWIRDIVRDVRPDSYSTQYSKTCYTIDPDIYRGVQAQLTAEHIPFELKMIKGKPCMIVNGNVLIHRGQELYLATAKSFTA